MKKRDFLFYISMSVCLFMKTSFQHIHPAIEICFASKTEKSLNKKDELRSIKNASLNKNCNFMSSEWHFKLSTKSSGWLFIEHEVRFFSGT